MLGLTLTGLGTLGRAGPRTVAPVLAQEAPAIAAERLISPRDRRAFDLSRYRVRDPDAGWFDLQARRAVLDQATDPRLLTWTRQAALGVSCRAALSQPVIDWHLALPDRNLAPADWEAAMAVFRAAEDTPARLAAAWVAGADPAQADCLVDLLARWAEHGALMADDTANGDRQAWLALAGPLRSAALAYATVASFARARDAAAARRIEAWLETAARRHLAVEGGDDSCCDSHFYGRAVYAGMVGVLTRSDDLFRIAVSALYSALYEMEPAGTLPRERVRGPRAWYHHNRALSFLVLVAQIIDRQGYRAFDLILDGSSLSTAIAHHERAIDNPGLFLRLTGDAQRTDFLDTQAALAWLDIAVSRFDIPTLATLARRHRPLFWASGGGALTLFFLTPQAGTTAARAARIDGIRIEHTTQCTRHPRWRVEHDTAWRLSCERHFDPLQRLQTSAGIGPLDQKD